jgi:hypothetical protein
MAQAVFFFLTGTRRSEAWWLNQKPFRSSKITSEDLKTMVPADLDIHVSKMWKATG